MKLGQLLASSNPKRRKKGFSILNDYFKNRDFTEKEMYQLWFAIHHAFFLTDNEDAQDAICDTLAGFLSTFNNKDRLLMYTKGFWFTMCGQWTKLDQYRINKYMYLVRIFYRGMLEHLFENKWEPGLMTGFQEILELLPMSGKNDHRGVSNHLCDLFLPELKKVVCGNVRISFETFLHLLEPYLKFQSIHSDKHLAKRCKRKIFDELFNHIRELEGSEDSLEMLAKLPKLSDYLFSIAKKKETKQANRSRLYDIKDEIDSFLARYQLEQGKKNESKGKKRKLETDDLPAKKSKIEVVLPTS